MQVQSGSPYPRMTPPRRNTALPLMITLVIVVVGILSIGLGGYFGYKYFTNEPKLLENAYAVEVAKHPDGWRTYRIDYAGVTLDLPYELGPAEDWSMSDSFDLVKNYFGLCGCTDDEDLPTIDLWFRADKVPFFESAEEAQEEIRTYLDEVDDGSLRMNFEPFKVDGWSAGVSDVTYKADGVNVAGAAIIMVSGTKVYNITMFCTGTNAVASSDALRNRIMKSIRIHNQRAAIAN